MGSAANKQEKKTPENEPKSNTIKNSNSPQISSTENYFGFGNSFKKQDNYNIISINKQNSEIILQSNAPYSEQYDEDKKNRSRTNEIKPTSNSHDLSLKKARISNDLKWRLHNKTNIVTSDNPSYIKLQQSMSLSKSAKYIQNFEGQKNVPKKKDSKYSINVSSSNSRDHSSIGKSHKIYDVSQKSSNSNGSIKLQNRFSRTDLSNKHIVQNDQGVVSMSLNSKKRPKDFNQTNKSNSNNESAVNISQQIPKKNSKKNFEQNKIPKNNRRFSENQNSNKDYNNSIISRDHSLCLRKKDMDCSNNNISRDNSQKLKKIDIESQQKGIMKAQVEILGLKNKKPNKEKKTNLEQKIDQEKVETDQTDEEYLIEHQIKNYEILSKLQIALNQQINRPAIEPGKKINDNTNSSDESYQTSDKDEENIEESQSENQVDVPNEKNKQLLNDNKILDTQEKKNTAYINPLSFVKVKKNLKIKTQLSTKQDGDLNKIRTNYRLEPVSNLQTGQEIFFPIVNNELTVHFNSIRKNLYGNSNSSYDNKNMMDNHEFTNESNPDFKEQISKSFAESQLKHSIDNVSINQGKQKVGNLLESYKDDHQTVESNPISNSITKESQKNRGITIKTYNRKFDTLNSENANSFEESRSNDKRLYENHQNTNLLDPNRLDNRMQYNYQRTISFAGSNANFNQHLNENYQNNYEAYNDPALMLKRNSAFTNDSMQGNLYNSNNKANSKLSNFSRTNNKIIQNQHLSYPNQVLYDHNSLPEDVSRNKRESLQLREKLDNIQNSQNRRIDEAGPEKKSEELKNSLIYNNNILYNNLMKDLSNLRLPQSNHDRREFQNMISPMDQANAYKNLALLNQNGDKLLNNKMLQNNGNAFLNSNLQNIYDQNLQILLNPNPNNLMKMNPNLVSQNDFDVTQNSNNNLKSDMTKTMQYVNDNHLINSSNQVIDIKINKDIKNNRKKLLENVRVKNIHPNEESAYGPNQSNNKQIESKRNISDSKNQNPGFRKDLNAYSLDKQNTFGINKEITYENKNFLTKNSQSKSVSNIVSELAAQNLYQKSDSIPNLARNIPENMQYYYNQNPGLTNNDFKIQQDNRFTNNFPDYNNKMYNRYETNNFNNNRLSHEITVENYIEPVQRQNEENLDTSKARSSIRKKKNAVDEILKTKKKSIENSKLVKNLIALKQKKEDQKKLNNNPDVKNQNITTDQLVSEVKKEKENLRTLKINDKRAKIGNDQSDNHTMKSIKTNQSHILSSNTVSVRSYIDEKSVWGYYGTNNEKSIKHTNSVITVCNEGKKTINQYILGRTIGQGNFGKVKKVQNIVDKEYYAIKILNRKMLAKKTKSDIDNEQNTEIMIKKKMAHPFIVKQFEVIEDEKKGKLYLVMDYMSKGALMSTRYWKKDLGDVYTKDKRPKCQQMHKVKKYWKELILGVDYLHNVVNVVHRDIKPVNLQINEEDTLKIADFGISEINQGTDETNKKSGTKYFLPPEIYQGNTFKSTAIDIWSLGITLYFIVYGKLPFYSDNFNQFKRNIAEDAQEYPEPPDPDLEDILNKMLNKNQFKRCTIKDLLVHPWTTENGKIELINHYNTDDIAYDQLSNHSPVITSLKPENEHHKKYKDEFNMFDNKSARSENRRAKSNRVSNKKRLTNSKEKNNRRQIVRN